MRPSLTMTVTAFTVSFYFKRQGVDETDPRRGTNLFVGRNLFITEQALANPFGFRFQARFGCTAHDFCTLGFRHADPDVQGFYFCFWLFGTASHKPNLVTANRDGKPNVPSEF